MTLLGNYNSKYILHDCMITNIESLSRELILYFSGGLYFINGNTDKYELNECNLVLKKYLWGNSEEEHTTIYKFSKNKRMELSFKTFVNIVRKEGLRIYLDFYSDFAKAILLKGFSKRTEIEIIIKEIESIELGFT